MKNISEQSLNNTNSLPSEPKDNIEIDEYNTPPPNYENHKQTHAFSLKLSGAQVFAVLLISVEVIVYFTVINNLDHNLGLLIVYCISGVVILISYVVSCCDPTDRVVYSYGWALYLKKKPSIQGTSYCDFCNSVCHQRSKHCRVCNR